MACTTSQATITSLRDISSRHGLSEIFVSDNGLQFSSHNLKGFVLTIGLCIVHSAPYKPSTNGQAERVVQTLKTAIKQAQATQIGVSV